MRTFFFFIACILFFSCEKDCEPCQNPTPTPTPEVCTTELTKGLLAYYPFNGNANDASGNGNNGTPMNGAFFTKDFLGRSNQAAGFDGINDYIIVNDGGKLNTDTVTVSLLVLVNNTSRRHSLVERGTFSNGTATTWGVGQSLDATNKWEFGVHNNNCTSQYVYNAEDFLYSSETMEAGRWYHILCEFANAKQSIYINGELRASVTRSFPNLKKCNGANLTIGAWWQNDIVSVDGKIDEVRIYNRVLNTCEKKQLSSGFGQ